MDSRLVHINMDTYDVITFCGVKLEKLSHRGYNNPGACFINDPTNYPRTRKDFNFCKSCWILWHIK